MAAVRLQRLHYGDSERYQRQQSAGIDSATVLITYGFDGRCSGHLSYVPVDRHDGGEDGGTRGRGFAVASIFGHYRVSRR